MSADTLRNRRCRLAGILVACGPGSPLWLMIQIGEDVRNQSREAGVDTGRIRWWNTKSDGRRSAELAIEAAQRAAGAGTFVAADLNYRAKVEPDRNRARAINREIAPHLGFPVGKIHQVIEDFPNLSPIGTQWRATTNADLISWGAPGSRPSAEVG